MKRIHFFLIPGHATESFQSISHIEPLSKRVQTGKGI